MLIKARLILESQGRPPEAVEKSLVDLVEKLKKVKDLEVFDVKPDKATPFEGEVFSALTDVGVKTEKFETLMQVVMNFGPSAVIILEPAKATLDSRDIQNALNDVATMVHTLSQVNLMEKMHNYTLGEMLKKATHGGMKVSQPELKPKESAK